MACPEKKESRTEGTLSQRGKERRVNRSEIGAMKSSKCEKLGRKKRDQWSRTQWTVNQPKERAKYASGKGNNPTKDIERGVWGFAQQWRTTPTGKLFKRKHGEKKNVLA